MSEIMRLSCSNEVLKRRNVLPNSNGPCVSTSEARNQCFHNGEFANVFGALALTGHSGRLQAVAAIVQ